jgi:hypothetical protein
MQFFTKDWFYLLVSVLRANKHSASIFRRFNQQRQNKVDDSENLYAPSIAKILILLALPGMRFPSASTL